ncbi:hypothetical protein DSECCO2_295140 [anaerobic digester metagenome]
MCFLNLVMQLEALQQAGTDRHTRTSTRIAHRNGSRDRTFARSWDVVFRKPQFRKKTFERQV